MTRGSRQPAARDLHARLYLAITILGGGTIVAVEALLVAPGHLLAAQFADALLVLLLVNVGPRGGPLDLTPRATAALAALRALALLPLIRVVAMGLPMRSWSEPLAILAIAGSVGFVALRLAPIVGVALRPLFSLRPHLADLYAILAGAVLGFVAYVAGAPALWPDGAAGDRIAVALAAVMIAASVEELVFRGLVQGTLQRVAGRLGTLAAAALFAASYLDAGSAPLILSFALAGIVFGHVVSRSGALAGAIAGHVILIVGAGAAWPAVFDSSQLADPREPRTTIALSAAIAVAVAVAIWNPCEAPGDAT